MAATQYVVEIDGVTCVVAEVLQGLGVTFDSVAAALAQADDAISFNDQILQDVADPVDNQDVATKAYVDANSGGGGGTRVQNTANGNLSAGNRDSSYTNEGATGAVAVNLPTSAAIGSSRWRGRFMTVAGQVFRFNCQGLDTINFFGMIHTGLQNNTPGETIDIEYAGGGVFLVIVASGTGWVA